VSRAAQRSITKGRRFTPGIRTTAPSRRNGIDRLSDRVRMKRLNTVRFSRIAAIMAGDLEGVPTRSPVAWKVKP